MSSLMPGSVKQCQVRMKNSITFLAVYDHGTGKGIPLPKLQTQMAVSAAVDEAGNVRGAHKG